MLPKSLWKCLRYIYYIYSADMHNMRFNIDVIKKHMNVDVTNWPCFRLAKKHVAPAVFCTLLNRTSNYRLFLGMFFFIFSLNPFTWFLEARHQQKASFFLRSYSFNKSTVTYSKTKPHSQLVSKNRLPPWNVEGITDIFSCIGNWDFKLNFRVIVKWSGRSILKCNVIIESK